MNDFFRYVEQEARRRFPSIDFTLETCHYGIAVLNEAGEEIDFYEWEDSPGTEERVRY